MDSTRLTLLVTGYLLAAGLLLPCQAEITVDGSLGNDPSALTPGPNQEFTITEGLGKKAGNNLFHSFGVFNIGEGETATFSGTSPIENILSRVTGGSASNIDGTLRTDFANATPNLYLINPAGVLFGPSASLDVQGSFHVSTADFVRLEDGARFTSVPSAEDQVLTTVPPEAFGFLADNPAGISIQSSNLQAPSEKTLSVVGGEITVAGGNINAPNGQIDVWGINAADAVNINDPDPDIRGFEQGEDITFSDGSLIDTRGEGGGSVFIRGGRLVVDNSDVNASTEGELNGRGIDIETDTLSVTNGGEIRSSSFGDGDAGNIEIDTGELTLDDGDIFGSTFAAGRAGDVSVTASGSVILSNDSFITSNSLEPDISNPEGDAGRVSITTPNLDLTGGGIESVSGANSRGNGGEIVVDALNLTIRNGAKIDSGAFGEGNAGNVRVKAATLSMSGNGASGLTGIFSQSELVESGDAGNVTINADNLDISGNSQIGTSTFSNAGKGGDLNVNVSGDVRITDNPDDETQTGIFSITNGFGQGGSLFLSAGRSILVDAGRILTRTLGNADSGPLNVNADSLMLINGAQIFGGTGDAEAGGPLLGNPMGMGNSGDITITVANTISISGEDANGFLSGIFSNTQLGEGKAGRISVTAKNLNINDSGEISTNTSGLGNAGELTIKTDNLDVRNGGEISASTFGSGNSGTLMVEADKVFLSSDGSSDFTGIAAQANSESTGDAGDLTVKVADLKVLNGAVISARTFGEGNSGLLSVEAETILLSDEGSLTQGGIIADAQTGSSGDARGLSIKTTTLEVRDGAVIGTGTFGSGRAGILTVEADAILLSGDGSTGFTGIASLAGADSSGSAGDINLMVDGLVVQNSAEISASTRSTGKSGNVSISASTISLDSGGAIAARSESSDLDIAGNPDSGRSGEISVTASNTLQLENGSEISVETEKANAGNIDIQAGKLLRLADSSITTSVADGQGDGGNIGIDPEFVVLDNSRIVAQAREGSGGNITIVADNLFQSSDSIVDASSDQGGIDGTVNIDSPDTNISGSIAVLPETYINAADQLSERCSARSANLNSFTVKGRGAVPLAPEDFAPSTSQDNGLGGKISKHGAALAYWYTSNLESSSGIPGLTEKYGNHPQLTPLGFGCGQ